ncbi:hypothetical protein AGMMS49942_19560 [Spirochaetia bacterium]|nr:hypothetical protein AGMMS49942_19560 [Spirochaetia bacterium]
MKKIPENCRCKKCKHGFGCWIFGQKHVKKMLGENKCGCVDCDLFKSGTCPLLG